MDVAANAKT